MSLKVSFELSARDVRHFREAMRKARHSVRDADDAEIIEAARGLFAEVGRKRVPAFVKDRIDRLEAMVGMLEDPDWPMPRAERERILAALVYFCDPEDLIPDNIPGLGFIDDAIMVELAFRELRHEIDAYQDFRQYREKYDSGFHLLRSADARARKLKARREQLQKRVARRRARDLQQRDSAARIL